MLKDLTVAVPDQPGTLAHIADAIGSAGINIEAFSGDSVEGTAVLHLLVEDSRAVRAILDDDVPKQRQSIGLRLEVRASTAPPKA